MSGFARFRIPQRTAYVSYPNVAEQHTVVADPSSEKECQTRGSPSQVSFNVKQSLDKKKVHNDENSTRCQQNVNQGQKVAVEEAIKLRAEFDRLIKGAELHIQENEDRLPCLEVDPKCKFVPSDLKEGSLQWLEVVIRQVCHICQMSQTSQLSLSGQNCGNIQQAVKLNNETFVAWEDHNKKWTDLLALEEVSSCSFSCVDTAHGNTGLLEVMRFQSVEEELRLSQQVAAAAVAGKERAEACLAIARKELEEERRINDLHQFGAANMKMELDRFRELTLIMRARLEEQAVELHRLHHVDEHFSTLQIHHEATLQELAVVRGSTEKMNKQHLGLSTEHKATLDELAKMRDRVRELEEKQEKIRLRKQTTDYNVLGQRDLGARGETRRVQSGPPWHRHSTRTCQSWLQILGHLVLLGPATVENTISKITKYLLAAVVDASRRVCPLQGPFI